MARLGELLRCSMWLLAHFQRAVWRCCYSVSGSFALLCDHVMIMIVTMKINTLLRIKVWSTIWTVLRLNILDMCLFIYLFFFCLGAIRIIEYMNMYCKFMVEPFGTTCEPHSGSKSSLISFCSYTEQIYCIPWLVFTVNAEKNNSFDSIVLFFDNMP